MHRHRSPSRMSAVLLGAVALAALFGACHSKEPATDDAAEAESAASATEVAAEEEPEPTAEPEPSAAEPAPSASAAAEVEEAKAATEKNPAQPSSKPAQKSTAATPKDTAEAKPAATTKPEPKVYSGDKPCLAKKFRFSAVKQACERDGQLGAKRLMKQVVKKAKAGGESTMKCKSCHKNTKDYALKDNAVADFKKWL